VRVERGTETIATERREIGLRPLGMRGRQLFLAGKNFVLRGIHTTSTTARLPREWHDAAAALVCDQVDDELLSEASQWGALSQVFFEASGDELNQRLQLIARYPGAAIAVFQGDVAPDFNKPNVAPNLLLAQQINSTAPAAPWADLLIVSADHVSHLHEVAAAAQKPIMVVRRLAAPLPLAEARAACDALQRDLAPLGQFAGYIV
jgi:hypothetical protein